MDTIKLGSGRKREDFQYAKQIQKHLNSIVEEGDKKMTTVNSKAEADSWPHQCRYYKPCEELVQNPSHNYGHFKRVHPWTDEERDFLIKLFEKCPTSKNVYILSVLYGRSENELKSFFKTQVARIPKWGKKTDEIASIHEMLQQDIKRLRSENKIKVEEISTEVPVQLELDPIPSKVEEIQSQNYLIPPDKTGSPTFYKNLVDALFEKHKTWVEREDHLKNRVIELDNTIIELRNKIAELTAELEEPVEDMQVEEITEYNEQINQIYQGF